MHISEAMTATVITVVPETAMAEVARLLYDRNLTGIPVIDHVRHVIGIVTEYDLMSHANQIHIPTYMKLLGEFHTLKKDTAVRREIEQIQQLKVEDIMTRPVVTISGEAEVAEAARIFADERINPLPVVDGDGVLVGIISRADIVKLFKTLA